jgi:AraC family transcriptional regulator, arabinose operon regulatory protein
VSLAARHAAPPAYGVLSAIAKDQLYWFGARGFVFTSPWVVTARTVRHPGVVLLSASGKSFELELNGRTEKCDAVAIAPHIVRGLRAVDVALVSVNVEVHHPRYGVFCGIPAPGVAHLDREAFRALDPALQRAYEGALTRVEAEQLLEAVVARAVVQLPNGRCRDVRADPLRAFLREHPTCSLGDVARELRVSYARASRLFSRAVGMPLRTYQHWLKCIKAAEQFGVNATWTEIAQEAGFTDSAHFARTWQRSFGHPPSYVRDRRHVRVVA